MHTIQNGKIYREVVIRAFVRADSEAEATDGLNETLRAAMMTDEAFVGDYSLDPSGGLFIGTSGYTEGDWLPAGDRLVEPSSEFWYWLRVLARVAPGSIDECAHHWGMFPMPEDSPKLAGFREIAQTGKVPVVMPYFLHPNINDLVRQIVFSADDALAHDLGLTDAEIQKLPLKDSLLLHNGRRFQPGDIVYLCRQSALEKRLHVTHVVSDSPALHPDYVLVQGNYYVL